MQLVEQHVIKRGDPRYGRIDEAAFASKNLWNLANYYVRQSFIFEHIYLDNTAVYHLVKSSDAYKALPAKVSNQVLIQLHNAWVAFFVNGRPIKAVNQLYNKHRARHQSRLAKQNRLTSRQLDRITTKRNRRIMQYLHTASRRIIDLLVQEGIGTLILGKNPLWKQRVELGKKHNQEFVQLPHAKFIELLTYKAALMGIRVILTEESYTSRASFLDRDEIPVYDPARIEEPRFSGRRDGRWYYASGKRIIHSDVNGSYNIGRKVVPTAFDGLGIAAPAVRPRRLAV